MSCISMPLIQGHKPYLVIFIHLDIDMIQITWGENDYKLLGTLLTNMGEYQQVFHILANLKVSHNMRKES